MTCLLRIIICRLVCVDFVYTKYTCMHVQAIQMLGVELCLQLKIVHLHCESFDNDRTLFTCSLFLFLSSFFVAQK